MLNEEKSVKHVLTMSGETLAMTESGYHLESVAETLLKLRDENAEACDKAWAKWFGPESDCGKAAKAVKAISAKKPEDQTDEDRKIVAEFIKLRDATAKLYVADGPTPKVESTWTDPDGNETQLFSGDLRSVCEAVKLSLRDPKRIRAELGSHIFELMRKSGLKLAAIALVFDEDGLPPGEKNHSTMAFGSAFREITEHDVDVFEGTLSEIRDNTVPEIKRKIGIQEGPKLIVPGNPGGIVKPQ